MQVSPMKLRIIRADDGTYKVCLDETLLHHVEEYKIESSTIKGKVELSLKMLVEFPIFSENDLKRHLLQLREE